MTTSEDFGIPAEVPAETRAFHREVLSLLTAAQPVQGILDRQRDAMEAIRRSYETALQAQTPPQTRQQLADLVHLLQAPPLRATAHPGAVTVSVEAEQAVAALMPQTQEEANNVAEGVAEIRADPELNGKLQRLASETGWTELGEEARRWAPWVMLAWVADKLFQIADWPVTQHLSPDQIAALQNRFMALAVIVALAQIIYTARRP